MASKQPRTNKPKAFIVYMTPEEHKRLAKFAQSSRLPMTQVMREALNMRLNASDPYITGFNEGMMRAVDIVASNPLSQMKFPNQKTLAEVMYDEVISKQMRVAT